MIKNIFLMVFGGLIFSYPSQASDPLCGHGSLQVDFIQVQTFALENVYTIHIHGTLDTPNPDYGYALVLDEGAVGEMAQGRLSLNDKHPDLSSIAVITSLEIDGIVKVSNKARGIFINVSKTFNWGPEYFTVKFDDMNSMCMSPEMYK